MTDKWPSFSTSDLGDSDEDGVEMFRRWHVYEREMRALIATGRFHEDSDGWWVETATGELVGPAPEIERPLMEGDEIPKFMTFAEAYPELAEAFRKARCRSSAIPDVTVSNQEPIPTITDVTSEDT